MLNILLLNQRTVHEAHIGIKSAGQGDLIYANRNGGLWRQRTRKFLTTGQLSKPYSVRNRYVTLGIQNMKQNVLLNLISLDHKENNKATVVEEKKKNQEKMTRWPEAKCMTDANGLHYFSVGKFQ